MESRKPCRSPGSFQCAEKEAILRDSLVSETMGKILVLQFFDASCHKDRLATEHAHWVCGIAGQTVQAITGISVTDANHNTQSVLTGTQAVDFTRQVSRFEGSYARERRVAARDE